MAQDIGNSNLLEVWASSGAVVEPDISKVEEGWQLGEQPPHEFMNWLQNTFGEKLNHVLSNGTPQWNSSTSYGAGSTVQRAGSVWIAMEPNANSEPAAGNTNWSRLLKLADASSEATADKLALRDENGTFKVGEATDPAHPALNGNESTVLTAQTISEQINELATANNAGTKAALNASGDAPIYACRAWVCFSGSGTVSIKASGNVSSITDNATGDYRVNFATPMSDTDYAFSGNSIGTTMAGNASSIDYYSKATSSVGVTSKASSSGSLTDRTDISVKITR